MKKKNGFTLVELLATLVVLGIVITITVITVSGSFSNAKNKTEDVFIKTIDDAMSIYLDSDARQLSYSTTAAKTINKTHGSVKVYKATANISFGEVIESAYRPITADDLTNPATEKKCKTNVKIIEIYRDDDYVYYYRIAKDNLSKLDCLLNTSSDIRNLP